MKDNTTKLLGLEDVIVKNVYENEIGCNIEVELSRRKHHCPNCGKETDHIHDYRVQKVKDLDMHGVHTYLHLRKRRYVCNACGKRFYGRNSFLPRYHRATNRLAAKVISDFRELRSAAKIARRNNISPPTAPRYFKLVSYSFDVPYSNGFTEGCNNKTKVLKRVCFGVSCFSTFRNRILHCASAS